MTTKSKNMKKNKPAKKASLGHVLKVNEEIEDTIKNASSELSLVNDVLRQKTVPVQDLKLALSQNEGVEQEIAKAADDLNLVNVQLAEEIADRLVVESELTDTKADLAEAREDLSIAQHMALQDALTGLPNRVSF